MTDTPNSSRPLTTNLPYDHDLRVHWRIYFSSPRNGEDDLPASPYPTTRTLAYASWLANKNDVEFRLKTREELEGPLSTARVHKKDTSDKICKELEGWILLGTAKAKSLFNGYHGIALWHAKDRQVIISHRGTKMSIGGLGSMGADMWSVMMNKVTDHLMSAVTFADQVLRHLNGHADNVFLVGHSLGGFLASVCTYSIQYLQPIPLIDCQEETNKQTDKTKMYFVFKDPGAESVRPHTVVFEAPGSKKILNKFKQYSEKSQVQSESLKELDITNYLSRPSAINSVQRHVGDLITIHNTPNPNVSKHKIKSFFPIFNEKTGNINVTMNRVTDWGHLRKHSYVFGQDEVSIFRSKNSLAGRDPDDYSINTSRKSSVTGSINMRYSGKPCKEEECVWVTLIPAAREFLKLYKKLQSVNPNYESNVPQLRQIEKFLQSCDTFASELMITFSTTEEKRTVIPILNQLCSKNTNSFTLLTQKNLHETRHFLQVDYENELSLDDLNNVKLVVCDEDAEFCVHRLKQAIDKSLSHKIVFIYHDKNSMYLEFIKEGIVNITKRPEQFCIIVCCSNTMHQEEYSGAMNIFGPSQTHIYSVSNAQSHIGRQPNNLDLKTIRLGKTRWRGLTEKCKRSLTNKTCLTFQGSSEKMCLSDVLMIGEGDSLDTLDVVINEETLMQLIVSEEIRVMTDLDDFKESDYLPRLFHEAQIEPTCFQEETNKRFYIKGISKEDFTGTFDVNPRVLDNLHFVNSFEEVTNEENRICLVWSSGRKLLLNGGGKLVDSFINFDPIITQRADFGKVINIYGDPGTGKSTSLKYISHVIKQRSPQSHVIFINLSEHIDVFRQYKHNMKQISSFEDLNEILADGLLKLKTTIEKNILSYSLKNPKRPVSIVLDSFDELSPKHKKIVMKMVTALTKLTNLRHLIISTRRHLPFSSQSLFLDNFNPEELQRFFKIQQIDMNHAKEMGPHRSLPSNPLILDILLKIEKHKQRLEAFATTSVTDSGQDNKNKRLSNTGMSLKLQSGVIRKYYESLAQHLLMQFDGIDEFKIHEHFTASMLGAGLIQISNDNSVVFVNQSYASYFAACWLFERLRHSLVAFLLPKILTELLVWERYSTVRFYLNDMLENIKMTSRLKYHVKKYIASTRRNGILLSIKDVASKEGNRHIFNYFMIEQ